jgi:hypothetical protein
VRLRRRPGSSDKVIRCRHLATPRTPRRHDADLVRTKPKNRGESVRPISSLTLPADERQNRQSVGRQPAPAKAVRDTSRPHQARAAIAPTMLCLTECKLCMGLRTETGQAMKPRDVGGVGRPRSLLRPRQILTAF